MNKAEIDELEKDCLGLLDNGEDSIMVNVKDIRKLIAHVRNLEKSQTEFSELRDNFFEVLRKHEPLMEYVRRLESALTRIAEYRSDKPDWIMVLSIASEALNPTEMICQEAEGE